MEQLLAIVVDGVKWLLKEVWKACWHVVLEKLRGALRDLAGWVITKVWGKISQFIDIVAGGIRKAKVKYSAQAQSPTGTQQQHDFAPDTYTWNDVPSDVRTALVRQELSVGV